MSGSVAVTRAIAVPGLLLLLIIATALSLLIGAKSLPASVVLEAFSGTCQSADCTIVLDARLPRTLAGLLAGGALGLAGALMQTLTRNPLAWRWEPRRSVWITTAPCKCWIGLRRCFKH